MENKLNLYAMWAITLHAFKNEKLSRWNRGVFTFLFILLTFVSLILAMRYNQLRQLRATATATAAETSCAPAHREEFSGKPIALVVELYSKNVVKTITVKFLDESPAGYEGCKSFQIYRATPESEWTTIYSVYRDGTSTFVSRPPTLTELELVAEINSRS